MSLGGPSCHRISVQIRNRFKIRLVPCKRIVTETDEDEICKENNDKKCNL